MPEPTEPVAKEKMTYSDLFRQAIPVYRPTIITAVSGALGTKKHPFMDLLKSDDVMAIVYPIIDISFEKEERDDETGDSGHIIYQRITPRKAVPQYLLDAMLGKAVKDVPTDPAKEEHTQGIKYLQEYDMLTKLDQRAFDKVGVRKVALHTKPAVRPLLAAAIRYTEKEMKLPIRHLVPVSEASALTIPSRAFRAIQDSTGANMDDVAKDFNEAKAKMFEAHDEQDEDDEDNDE